MGQSVSDEGAVAGGAGRRVLLIGLDGATFDLLDGWMDRGLMPNVRRLATEGVRATMRSVLPPVTGPAWASLSTGVLPGKHGIFDFRKRVPGQPARQIVSRQDLQVPTLWDMLADAGKQVGLINLPVTYPPSARTSFHITDMLTPNTGVSFTHPSTLYEELRPELGEYIIDAPPARLWNKRAVMPFLENLERCTIQRARYGAHLLRTRPWDVAMVVFLGTDRIQHVFWDVLTDEFKVYPRDREILAMKDRAEEYLRLLDRSVGELIAAVPPDTDILIVSDHGFGPLRRRLKANKWLARHKLLTPSRRRGLLGRAIATADVFRLRHRVVRLAVRLLPSQGGLIPKFERPFWRWINWAATRAYTASATEMGVYVNLQGREVHGSVKPEEYEQVRDEILACIQKLRHPETGGPIVNLAARREEVFQGTALEDAPDVVFAMEDGACAVDVRMEGPLWEKASWRIATGTHRFEGILIGCGPRIRSGQRLGEVQIVDIAPTVLRLCGLAAPEHMDGRALTELLTDAVAEPTTVAAASARQREEGVLYTEEEARQVESRLRDLGYL